MIGRSLAANYTDITAIVAASTLDINEVLSLSNKLSNDLEFILILNYEKEILKKLLPAYINVRLRREELCMRSSMMQKEMLLFLAGTMNINNAIKKIGALSEKKFIVIGTSKTLINKFKKIAKLTKIKQEKLYLNIDDAADIALTEIISSH